MICFNVNTVIASRSVGDSVIGWFYGFDIHWVPAVRIVMPYCPEDKIVSRQLSRLLIL